MTQAARLRAVLLPPMRWRPGMDAWRPGEGPDPWELFRALAGHGIDPVLIDPGGRPWNPLAGRGTVLESLDPLRALRVLATERRADIVVSVFEGAALPLTLLRGLARFPPPVVLWDLGLTEQWKLRERILDRVVPRVDGIFVLSASQKSYIEQRWGGAGVEVLGHSIDTGFFAPAPFQPEGPVLALGDDAGRDYPALLDVAARVPASLILKTRLLSAGHAVPANVTVARERISDLALRQLYADSRFVVVPLHQTLNASGVSTILEAGAMGRAMVVSDNPAIRDFILPDETCLVVPCGDRAALAAAITRLLREPQTCQRLGETARRFIEQHCSRKVFARRLATLLRRYAKGGETDSTTSLERNRAGTLASNASGATVTMSPVPYSGTTEIM